jgi:UDP-GlcNAc:undecaprenyl-phosphate GlcNAc-1-phosphate transferase
MYFWSALISFGALAYSVNSGAMWSVLVIAALSAVGLVLLLLPRFTPRAPRWAEHLLPPRYRRRRAAAAAARDMAPVTHEAAPESEPDEAREHRSPVVSGASGVSGVNGATAIGARSSLLDRREAESSH